MGSNYKKSAQLGMHHSTASAQLKKKILFDLLKKLGQNYCFQCGAEIESEEELSVEHKIPWLDSDDPKRLFFDLDNIAFSHLSCNISAARTPTKIEGLEDKRVVHGSIATYNRRGCRCDKCTETKKRFNARRNKQ